MMYPTGYSDKGIDFSQAAQNLNNSYIQSKVSQAKQRMGELSESEKYILKSADMATIPEVSGKLREKFDQDIQSLRQKTIDLVRQRNGKLTSADKGEIEKSAIDVQNRMTRAKVNLEEFAKKQEYLMKPGMDQVLNLSAAQQELGRLSERLQAGEDVGTDIAALPIKHAILKSEGQLFTDQIKSQIAQIGTKGTMKYEGGKMVVSTATDEADARNTVEQQLTGNSMWLPQVAEKDAQGNVLYNAGKPVIDQVKLQAKVDEFLPLVTKTTTVEKPIPSRGRGTGSTTAPLQLTGDPGTLGKTNYEAAFDMSAPQTTTAMLKEVTNEETGATEKMDSPTKITVLKVGVSNGKPRIIFSAAGSMKTKGGKQVYSSSGDDLGAVTKDEAVSSAQSKAQAEQLLPKGEDFKIEGEPDVKETNDGLVLTYKAVLKRNIIGKAMGRVDKAMTVSVPLKPVSDEKKEGLRSVPLTPENIELIPLTDRKRKITVDGKTTTVDEYLRGTIGASNTTKPTAPSTKSSVQDKLKSSGITVL